jgi:hypothetical protein
MARLIEAEARITAVDATGPVFDNVAAKVNKLHVALDQVGGSAMKFGGVGVRAMNDVGTAAEKVDATISKIGAALASGYLLHKIAELGREAALAYANLDDVRRMQAAALGGQVPPALLEQQQRLGRGATRFSQTEIAKAQLEVMQEGIDPGLVAPIIDIAKVYAPAVGAGGNLPEAAKHLAQMTEALKQVGQEGAQLPAAVSRIADMAVKMHQIGGMSEADVSEAFTQGGVAAIAAGLSPATFAALITTAHRTGLGGGAAGMGVRMMVSRLLAPGKKGLDALEDMGIDYDAFAKGKGLSQEGLQKHLAGQFGPELAEKMAASTTDVFADEDAMGNKKEFVERMFDAISPDKKDAKALTKALESYYKSAIEGVDVEGLLKALEGKPASKIIPLFGARAAGRVIPFLRDQEQLEQLTGQYATVKEGTAAAAAAEMGAGVGGAGRRLEAAKESFMERAGEVFATPLAGIENATTRFLQSLSDQGVKAVSGLTAWTGGLGTYALGAKVVGGFSPGLAGMLPGGRDRRDGRGSAGGCLWFPRRCRKSTAAARILGEPFG